MHRFAPPGRELRSMRGTFSGSNRGGSRRFPNPPGHELSERGRLGFGGAEFLNHCVDRLTKQPRLRNGGVQEEKPSPCHGSP
ncbi:hypothetical protein PO909_002162 [Leuciscus waleckii]